jgi:hypothetical protein
VNVCLLQRWSNFALAGPCLDSARDAFGQATAIESLGAAVLLSEPITVVSLPQKATKEYGTRDASVSSFRLKGIHDIMNVVQLIDAISLGKKKLLLFLFLSLKFD